MAKRIFHPGAVVTTSWLNSSQYLGPSNQGVVFVANPVNDWEYPLLKGSSVDLVDFSSYFVARSGNQAIDDTKTFTSIPNFPTSSQLTGSQGVNVDKLNFAVAALNTTLSSDISTLAADFAAQNVLNNNAIAALTSNLNTNFVTLGTNQSITGTKTFSAIQVPTTPVGATAPVSLQYFIDNAVTDTGAQTILGTKTFADIQVPSPSSSGDAVNLAYLNAVTGTVPIISEGCIRIGTIQIVFGVANIIGAWGAGGILTTGAISFSATAPNSVPFLFIPSGGISHDKFITVQTVKTTSTITFTADQSLPSAPTNNAAISWFVIGYTA